MERLTFLAPSLETDVEITVKRSRFIGSVRMLSDAAEAQQKLNEIVQKFPKATHYCWAYRVGIKQPLEHCSDAGEPAGTAGRPILGAIKRIGLENTLIVVTRYFGGVKLGVRGLIDAYGDAAQLAADACKAAEMEFCKKLTLACGYDYSKTLLTTLDKFGFGENRRNTNFGETVEISLEVPTDKIEELSATLDEMYSRQLITELQWEEELLIRPCRT